MPPPPRARSPKPTPKRPAAPRRPRAPAPAPPEDALFFAAPPGLELSLMEEAAALGFQGLAAVPGGVTAAGGWPEAWRANLTLRGAGRVLMRVARMRTPHLAQLDKRARRVPWGAYLRPGAPVWVEAGCRASRIRHSGAAAERVATAIADAVGAPLARDAEVRVLARIEDDLCTLSIDTSGAPLHQRGAKLAVGKAPLRETTAALLLRACAHAPGEPVVDPMCGSGTIVLEAAERAAGLAPGRARGFAFERLASFDADAWAALRAACAARAARAPAPERPPHLGSDRDAGAVAAAAENAARAGLEGWIAFERRAVSDARPPEGPPGLVLVNPPYGGRIGERGALRALYGALGATLRARFGGWRVGLITSAPELARATGLPFAPPGPPIAHGGLKVRLHRAGPLP